MADSDGNVVIEMNQIRYVFEQISYNINQAEFLQSDLINDQSSIQLCFTTAQRGHFELN